MSAKPLSVPALIKTINAHIAKGDQAQGKSENHYISAGLHLQTLKDEHSESVAEWEAMVKRECNLGKSRAWELVKLVSGRSLEQTRAVTNDRQKKHRQIKASPLRNGEIAGLVLHLIPEDAAAIDPIQESCDDCTTKEEHWQRSLSNFAGDAVSMPAFWTRQFGAWDKFEVTPELVTLAKQAAEVWSELVGSLGKRKDHGKGKKA